jgi:hypothetical protein
MELTAEIPTQQALAAGDKAMERAEVGEVEATAGMATKELELTVVQELTVLYSSCGTSDD